MNDSPVVIQAALTGLGRRRGDGVPVPRTADEVVEDALAAWDAGAATVHLRAPGPDGAPSARAEHFEPLVDGIRAAGCDAILGFSCGAPDAGALDCLALGPELALIDCWGVDAAGFAFDATAESLGAALAELREAGTAPEVRCRHFGHVRTVLALHDEGALDDPLRVQLVVDDGIPNPIEQVLQLSAALPPGCVWSVAGIGARQLRLNVLCLIAGGHVRTGLEDNAWLVEDVPATNKELVQRIVRIVDDLDRPLATPEEAREIVGLPLVGGEVDLRLAAG